jgi:hypothetical protein
MIALILGDPMNAAIARAWFVSAYGWPVPFLDSSVVLVDQFAQRVVSGSVTLSSVFFDSRMLFSGSATPLTTAGIAAAAKNLNVEKAVIEAVTSVEAQGTGFLNDGEPKILFERHKFSQFTHHRFDRDYPKISNRTRGGYVGGAKEYERLSLAASLDYQAALKASSWGMFQILGANFKACGYAAVNAFVDDMMDGEDFQLAAFVSFVKSQHLDKFLRDRDWVKFARAYNGPAYKENSYDLKLKEAYDDAKEDAAAADSKN